MNRDVLRVRRRFLVLGSAVGLAWIAACVGSDPSANPEPAERADAGPSIDAPSAASDASEPFDGAVPEGGGACPSGMAFVAGGGFTIARRAADGGAAAVTVAAYCLDLTEVTVQAFTARSGAAPTPSGSCNGSKAERQTHPVNCVDWAAATSFCTAGGKRLPTEEEFEWAARGSSAATAYPWGSVAPSVDQLCWKRQPVDGTCQVGRFPASRSPLGIDDLAGNVWEWTSSCADADCTRRIARGGGWFTDSDVFLRADYVDARLASSQSDVLGFRCASTP